jgi:5-methylthioadenosine/S-adenosylhomocysteine deaminase
MATIDAAKTLGLDREIGSIEIGKNADLTIVDMRKPHLQPVWDLVSNLVLCANGADVDTVIVDGEILMKRRKLTRLNESDVMSKSLEIMKRIEICKGV